MAPRVPGRRSLPGLPRQLPDHAEEAAPPGRSAVTQQETRGRKARGCPAGTPGPSRTGRPGAARFPASLTAAARASTVADAVHGMGHAHVPAGGPHAPGGAGITAARVRHLWTRGRLHLDAGRADARLFRDDPASLSRAVARDPP